MDNKNSWIKMWWNNIIYFGKQKGNLVTRNWQHLKKIKSSEDGKIGSGNEIIHCGFDCNDQKTKEKQTPNMNRSTDKKYLKLRLEKKENTELCIEFNITYSVLCL